MMRRSDADAGAGADVYAVAVLMKILLEKNQRNPAKLS
jgi:hypothetical protein